jgi:hypothetical protein
MNHWAIPIVSVIAAFGVCVVVWAAPAPPVTTCVLASPFADPETGIDHLDWSSVSLPYTRTAAYDFAGFTFLSDAPMTLWYTTPVTTTEQYTQVLAMESYTFPLHTDGVRVAVTSTVFLCPPLLSAPADATAIPPTSEATAVATVPVVPLPTATVVPLPTAPAVPVPTAIVVTQPVALDMTQAISVSQQLAQAQVALWAPDSDLFGLLVGFAVFLFVLGLIGFVAALIARVVQQWND